MLKKRITSLHPILAKYASHLIVTGDIDRDCHTFFDAHQFMHTYHHCRDVAQEAQRLARLFGANPEQATIAGWLHDSSNVIPVGERIATAHTLGIDVLAEESIFPMIIHQKLSVAVAEQIFGVHDSAILSAIGCHTTLKANASLLDKIVFVADKVAWDQPGNPPYQDAILKALDQSIDHAAYVYLDYLWQMRDKLKVLHPWAKDAYLQLQAQLG